MARHSRPSRFKLLPGTTRRSTAGRLDRRRPGATRELQPPSHQSPDLLAAAVEATDNGTLRQFLEAMRRWQSQEPTGPVEITPATIRSTVDYVLSAHLNEVPDDDLCATVLTLHEYLVALSEAAEEHLDTGRVVVAQMVNRARVVAGDDAPDSLRAARLAASTTRDLLLLLDQEGWPGTRAEVAS